MNRHLNLFHTYSKVNREQQLENDLTRALAICLQEDTVFLNSFLSSILDKETYESLFNDISNETNISIEIQRNVVSLEGFNKLFAVSITGLEMLISDFFIQDKSKRNVEYITDLVLLANDIAIIIEVKPSNVSCVNQLAQQAYKAIENATIEFNEVIAIDLNWKKLMAIAVQVSNFSRASGNSSRFLVDFIQFMRQHNHSWLPVVQFSGIGDSISKIEAYKQRLNAALSSIADEHPILNYNDRIGLKLNLGWAQEIVFYLRENSEKKMALYFGFWPGNTKGQGTRMYSEIGNINWQPPATITLQNQSFKLHFGYEIKFCHFNGFVSNFVVDDSKVKPGKQLISINTHKLTGKYDLQNWGKLEAFLDDYLIDSYDWRAELGWKKHFVDTKRNYLTLSIGYQFLTEVPISYLQKIDTVQDDLTKLTDLIIEMKTKYETIFTN